MLHLVSDDVRNFLNLALVSSAFRVHDARAPVNVKLVKKFLTTEEKSFSLERH